MSFFVYVQFQLIVLRVRGDVFRRIFNRAFQCTAITQAKCHPTIQIAWARNWGSNITNLYTGNRVLFYATFNVYAYYFFPDNRREIQYVSLQRRGLLCTPYVEIFSIKNFFYSISVRPKWGSKHICSFSGYNFSIFQKRSK